MDDSGVVAVVVICLFLLFFWMLRSDAEMEKDRVRRRQQLEEESKAWKAEKAKVDDEHIELTTRYFISLNELAKNKTTANRIAALKAGRKLMAFERKYNAQPPTVTELSLQNDLRAHGSED